MSVAVICDKDANEKLMKGIDTIYNAVASTMGPGGNTVIIDDGYGNPIVTKDGVTVAESIRLKDPFSNLGVQLVKQASKRTNDKVGDGTTTSTVLAWNIYNSYRNLCDEKVTNKEPIIKREVIKGINDALKVATNIVARDAVPIKTSDDIYNVAMISSNGDEEISKLITDAIDRVGKDGTITIDETNYSSECSLRIQSGAKIKSGYISRFFCNTTDNNQCVLMNPLILIVDKVISYANEIVTAMSTAANLNRPLVIFADDINGQALKMMVENRLKCTIQICGIKVKKSGDERRDLMEDLAVLTNTQVFDHNLGMKPEEINLAFLGTCEKITIDDDSSIILNGAGVGSDALKSRIEQIKKRKDEVPDVYRKHLLEERITSLSGDVAILTVGGMTEAELREKRDRVDDTIHAVNAAMSKGTVLGGGYALINPFNDLIHELKTRYENSDSYKIGWLSFIHALVSPFNIIHRNSQLPEYKVQDDSKNISSSSMNLFLPVQMYFDGVNGFDASIGESVNLRESGIIDPTEVTISSLINAVSIANVLISTNCIIASDADTNAKDNTDILSKV